MTSHSKTNRSTASPARPECISVGSLPEDVRARLTRAWGRQRRSSDVGDPDTLGRAAWDEARLAFKRVPANSSDAEVLGRLSDANAAVVAAMSADCGRGFPGRISIDGLLGLVNLFGSVGRELEASGQRELALARYMRSLKLMKTLVGYRRVPEVEKAAYWSMSRAATVVGQLAAEKAMSLHEMLADYDENLKVYDDLLGDEGDPSVPRVFAALGQARWALHNDANPRYGSVLVRELQDLAPVIEPRNRDAAKRFRLQLDALLTEVFEPGQDDEAGFRWSK